MHGCTGWSALLLFTNPRRQVFMHQGPYIYISWNYMSLGMRFPTILCATSKGSDQPAHMRNLIRAFASCLHILWVLSYWLNIIGTSKLKRRLHRFVWAYTCKNVTLLKITCNGSYGTSHEKAYFAACKQQRCRPACISAEHLSIFSMSLINSMISEHK